MSQRNAPFVIPHMMLVRCFESLNISSGKYSSDWDPCREVCLIVASAHTRLVKFPVACVSDPCN